MTLPLPEKQRSVSLVVTQASLNQTAMDFPRNLENIYAAIREAVAQGSDILALEELTLTGYEANDDFQKTDNDLIFSHLKDIAAYAAALDHNLIISVGHPWRLIKRDLPALPGLGSERLKNPLFNRLDLPFNAQSIISGGEIHSMTAKMYLFNDERGYEKRYFQEWSMQAANEAGGVFGTIPVTLPDGHKIPFGRPIVRVQDDQNGYNIDLTHIICEERWVASAYGGAPYSDGSYYRDGVGPNIMHYRGGKKGLVFIDPNASPPGSLKIDKHKRLIEMLSYYADAVVDTDGLGSSGSTFAQFGHRITAQNGQIQSYGQRSAMSRLATTTSTLTVTSAPVEMAAKAHTSITHIFRNAAQAAKADKIYESTPEMHGWDSPDNPYRHAEETIRMTALWLFDYMRKTGPQGIAEALSGGADSAFNSALVPIMVRLAVREMGVEGFLNEMPFLEYADKVRQAGKTGGTEAAIDVCIYNMLTAVYMGTKNNLDEHYEAARFLIEGGIGPDGEHIKGIGGKFDEHNIQHLLNTYAAIHVVKNLDDIEPVRRTALVVAVAKYLNQSPEDVTPAELDVQAAAIKAEFPEITGQLLSAADPRHSIAYENIQARAREVEIFAIANAEGKMAIANPNLDEARNAYATYGGDLHSGTINLNAHLPKAYQLQLMHYLYAHGLHGVMEPMRSLGKVLGNKPSAGLQPLGKKGELLQTDEDALQRNFSQMDRISRYMLYERVNTNDGMRRLNAGEVYEACQKDGLFAGVDENRLYNMIVISYKRWGISQHKIHASPIAPTFGLNVDHQSSLRTPNLSGGSKDELTLLGVNLISKWIKDSGGQIASDQESLLKKRAQQDSEFIGIFDRNVRNQDKSLKIDTNLRALANKVGRDGWGSVFPPLAADHPLAVIECYRQKTPVYTP